MERQETVSTLKSALRESEAKFRAVMESAIDAIISGDADGKVLWWNSAATALFGFTEEEAVGQPITLIIPERFRKSHEEGMERVSSGGPSHVIGRTVELAAVHKDGTEFPVELSLATWFLDDKRYYTGIIRDISKRKSAEDALLLRERELRDRTEELKTKNDVLMETLDRLHEMNEHLIIQEKMAALGRLSAGMAHELNNPAASAQRGAAQLEKMLSKWRDLQMRIAELELGQAPLKRLFALDQEANERAHQPVELSALTRSDLETEIEEWMNATGLECVAEFVPALVSLGYDRRSLEKLGEEFTTPQLEVVLCWLALKFEIYSLVSEISLGTGRIAELVKALKTYSYMDQAPVQSVDVREGLDNTLVILQNKLKGGVTVEKQYHDNVPVIQAYASELNQVWTNLIDNAIDAMGGKGRLIIRTRWEAPHVVVEIEDDGPGIPEDDQLIMFDPFFTTKPLGEGTGLGLNISRNVVVKKHHGDIVVESRPGRTCFIVRLPVDVGVGQ